MNFSRYEELLKRIRDEVGDLDRTTQRALRAWKLAKRTQIDADIYLDSATLNLQSFTQVLNVYFSSLRSMLNRSSQPVKSGI